MIFMEQAHIARITVAVKERKGKRFFQKNQFVPAGLIGIQFPFADGFGAYPNIWVEREGELVYGSVLPGSRDALMKLIDTYQIPFVTTMDAKGYLPEDHPLYGLVKFKRGFNGDYTEFVGEMDLILKPFINRSAKLGFDVLREVRMKLYLLRHRDKKTDHVKGTPSHPEGSGGTA